MCETCRDYEKFEKQARDAGLIELADFLKDEKARYVDAAVEANLS